MTDRLKLSWEITRLHLDAARKSLPRQREQPFDETISRYEEYLAHNELELAFEELEQIGTNQDCPRQFWQELLLAAQNMGLENHTARCKRKVELE